MLNTRDDTEDHRNPQRPNRRQLLVTAGALSALLVTHRASAAEFCVGADTQPLTLFGGGPCEGR